MNKKTTNQMKGYKQVKIEQRITLHKYVEVFVNVPTSVSEYDVEDWMRDNIEVEITDKIDKALDKAETLGGSGFYDYDGLDDCEEVETRFQVGDYGGHTYNY
tara:strand:+ start:226 stop:531 length:306 start_codon:yes stop_codon:yes gene_type:complete